MLIPQARALYERTGALRDHPVAGVAFAVGMVGLALAARFLIAGREGFPFLTFIPAVVITSFLCGWRAGALAAVLGALARWRFPDPLAAGTAVAGTGAAGAGAAVSPTLIGFSMYVFAVLIILGMVGAMHLAFRDFTLSEQQRRRLHAELEVRVRERTLELEAANQRLRDEAVSRAATEAQLHHMQKMEAIGQLTGGIAHDFNNMLAVIVGSLDIAKRHLVSDRQRAARFIDQALDGARRAGHLTSRLLAFARRQPLDPKPLDCNALVTGMSELLKRTLGENIRLEASLASEPWTVLADSSQLESAVVNLCVNSRDAMPEGGSLVLATDNVVLDARAAESAGLEPGDYVSITITDTGSGMTPEVLARAFDPFYTTKDPDKGTGLGLSQVYGFVKQSGGHVRIESQVGAGTSVRLFLPRHRGAVSSSLPEHARKSESSTGRESILVVEDEERVRSMTVEALRELGYRVMSTGNPEQALELIGAATESSPFDLLLTDLTMPHMSGRTLAERARRVRPDVKILFTTAHAPDTVAQQGILAEGVPFLAKPFTVEQLASTVRSALV